MRKARTLLQEENGGLFQSADRLVFAPANAPKPEILARLDAQGVPHSVADLSKSEAVAEIDNWVKETTKGAIPSILGGPLDNASVVALNALHFKGKWRNAFDPKLTTLAPFTGVDGKSAETKMMHAALGEREYRLDKRFVRVDLPFINERFSLTVVTTLDKPAPAKEFAKVATWLAGEGFAPRKGDLALPKFKLSQRSELLPALDALGLAKARRRVTAFEGFGKGAQLSQIVQQAMIEVDEEGAEAAAATAVMATRSLEADDNIHMVVDKPFVFALRDEASGMILLGGYVGSAPSDLAK